MGRPMHGGVCGEGYVFAELSDVIDGFTPHLENLAAPAIDGVRTWIQKGVAGETP